MKKSLFLTTFLIVLIGVSTSVSAKATITPKELFQGYLDSFSALSQKESKQNNTKIVNITVRLKANKFALVTKVYPNVISLTGSQYPGCDTPDLKVGTGVWAMCNVGISKYGNTVGKDRIGKIYRTEQLSSNTCASGYHIPTMAEWNNLITTLSTGGKDKNENFYTTRLKMIMGLSAGEYWIDTKYVYGLNVFQHQGLMLSETGFQNFNYYGSWNNGLQGPNAPMGLFNKLDSGTNAVRCIKN